jgi:hypothetical protein
MTMFSCERTARLEDEPSGRLSLLFKLMYVADFHLLTRNLKREIMHRCSIIYKDSHGVIREALVNIIDDIPTRNSTGNFGWLTAHFMDYFGWN